MTTRYINGRIFTADTDPAHAWAEAIVVDDATICLLYTSPSPRDS